MVYTTQIQWDGNEPVVMELYRKSNNSIAILCETACFFYRDQIIRMIHFGLWMELTSDGCCCCWSVNSASIFTLDSNIINCIITLLEITSNKTIIFMCYSFRYMKLFFFVISHTHTNKCVFKDSSFH